jgi:hypothetical protein
MPSSFSLSTSRSSDVVDAKLLGPDDVGPVDLEEEAPDVSPAPASSIPMTSTTRTVFRHSANVAPSCAIR